MMRNFDEPVNFPKKVVIIGAGDFGRETAEIAKRQMLALRNIELLGFLDSNEELHGKVFNNVEVLGGIDYFKQEHIFYVCSIGDPETKMKVVKKVEDLGYLPINIIDPSVVFFSGVKLGKGIVINALCGIMANVVIDDHVHINLLSSIGHDVQLGGYTTISPHCTLSGFTNVGEGCFFGSGVITFPRVKVGKWSKLGAGAVANKDIIPYTINVGVPAHSITRIEEHHAFT